MFHAGSLHWSRSEADEDRSPCLAPELSLRLDPLLSDSLDLPSGSRAFSPSVSIASEADCESRTPPWLAEASGKSETWLQSSCDLEATKERAEFSAQGARRRLVSEKTCMILPLPWTCVFTRFKSFCNCSLPVSTDNSSRECSWLSEIIQLDLTAKLRSSDKTALTSSASESWHKTRPTPTSNHMLRRWDFWTTWSNCCWLKTTAAASAHCSMYASAVRSSWRSKAPVFSWKSVFSCSGTGKRLPFQDATSMMRCPEPSLIISTQLPNFLKSMRLLVMSMMAPACSSKPTDKSWGMFSLTTVSLITPGLPPKMQGTREQNSGSALPPTPLAGAGTSFSFTGCNPCLAKALTKES